MEYNILSTLSFDITFPTALRFLERYLKLIGEDSVLSNYSLFLIEIALTDIRMIQYPPSVLAASALLLAYK
jgi:hypothetical protein